MAAGVPPLVRRFELNARRDKMQKAVAMLTAAAVGTGQQKAMSIQIEHIATVMMVELLAAECDLVSPERQGDD